MKVFHCDHCGHLLFFENTQCVRCGHLVAYLPDLAIVGSLDPNDDRRTTGWHLAFAARSCGRTHLPALRELRERTGLQLGDPRRRSQSAVRLLPADARHPGPLRRANHRQAWYRLEVAKRRLVFTLLQLASSDRQPRRRSRARARHSSSRRTIRRAPAVLTGHAGGLITINIAEADDAERERRRTSLHEPFRTLAGHFRHESGHYYWDRLISGPRAARRDSGRRSATNARLWRRPCSTYYANGPPPTGRIASSAPTRARIRWRTGPRPGRTTSTWSTRSRRPPPAASRFSRGDPTSRRWPRVAVRRVAGRAVRSADRQLVSGHLPAEQPQSRSGRWPTRIRSCWSAPAIEKLRFVHETVRGVRSTEVRESPG